MPDATPEPNKRPRPTAGKLAGPSMVTISSRVVIVCDDDRLACLLASLMRPTLGSAPSVLAYEHADDLFAMRPDLVVLVADAHGERWRRLAREFEHEFRMALAAVEPSIDDAAEAMRCGLVDLLQVDGPKHQLAMAVSALVQRALEAAEDRIPASLSLVPASTSPDGSGGDGQDVDLVQVRAEFGVLARLELDVESLLRTTLEYVLHKIGPTNAAVFLPTAGQDFTLGAYVNYDCPKDCVDMLLDHVAASVAPAIEADPSMRLHRGEEALDDLMGEHAAWLTGCEAVTFAAEHDGELLAAVALFRDDRDPFDAQTLRRLGVISDLLAQQLARIIRVHHRHLPKEQWDESEERNEDPPMAA